MARPKIQIDSKQLDALLGIRAPRAYVAERFGCSEDTIERYIQREHGVGFAAYREKRLDGTRLTLTQKMISLALGGNVTALIFCMKNLCGWSDKQEVSAKVETKSPHMLIFEAIEKARLNDEAG